MTGSASGPQVLTEEARLRTKRSSLIDQRIVFPSIQGARHSQCAPIMKCLDRERGHASSSMTRGAAQYRDGDGVLTFGLFPNQQQLCINNSSELCTVCPCVDIRLAQCVLTNICLQNMFSISLLVSIMIMIMAMTKMMVMLMVMVMMMMVMVILMMMMMCNAFIVLRDTYMKMLLNAFSPFPAT